MNAAIQQRVDQFVQDILGVVERVSTERRAAALSAVATMLTGAGRSAEGRASASRGARTPPKAATSPRNGARSTPPKKTATKPARGRRRGLPSTARVATAPMAVAPSSVTDESAVPATQRTPIPTSDAPAPKVAPSSPATMSSAPAAPVPEREARVLDAVRALGRTTAGEVAERTGLPNGSVVVALRGLVARGHVARAKTDRGVEYSLPAT